MTQEKFVDRYQIIGASEISGIIKEYSHQLLEKNIINQDIFNKLQSMPNYLETKYSLAKKLMLDKEHFEKFNNFNKTQSMIRGIECEELVKDDYLITKNYNRNEPIKVEQSQSAKDILIEGCMFPFRATIDYILSDNTILEVKTTDISRWEFTIEKTGLPFNYYIQAQAQLWLHEKEICNVYIAGIHTSKEKDCSSYTILHSSNFVVKKDEQIIEAIKNTLVLFSCDFNSGVLLQKKEDDKVKKDRIIDEFLTNEKETIEAEINFNLLKKIIRLKQIENIKKEYDQIEKEIKDEIKKIMTGYANGVFNSNEFKIEAKYTKETYYDEADVFQAVEKAKSIKPGDLKSSKRLTVKYSCFDKKTID